MLGLQTYGEGTPALLSTFDIRGQGSDGGPCPRSHKEITRGNKSVSPKGLPPMPQPFPPRDTAASIGKRLGLEVALTNDSCHNPDLGSLKVQQRLIRSVTGQGPQVVLSWKGQRALGMSPSFSEPPLSSPVKWVLCRGL